MKTTGFQATPPPAMAPGVTDRQRGTPCVWVHAHGSGQPRVPLGSGFLSQTTAAPPARPGRAQHTSCVRRRAPRAGGGVRGGRCGSPGGADSSLRHTRVRRPSCASCFKTACVLDTVHEASVTIYTFVTDENVDAPGG